MVRSSPTCTDRPDAAASGAENSSVAIAESRRGKLPGSSWRFHALTLGVVRARLRRICETSGDIWSCAGGKARA